MNRFVKHYIEGRKADPDLCSKRIILTAVVRHIANQGTMGDLKALMDYYENEMEEIKNDRNQTA